MSLGLFNCRLIQPAGDQPSFLSAVLPHQCHFGRALFSLPLTRPAQPRPVGGRRMLLVFPSQKGLVLVFSRKSLGRIRSTPVDSPAKPPNPTHRFCYRAENSMPYFRFLNRLCRCSKVEGFRTMAERRMRAGLMKSHSADETTARRCWFHTSLRVRGIHFVQEDSPDEIGQAIAGWMGALG